MKREDQRRIRRETKIDNKGSREGRRTKEEA